VAHSDTAKAVPFLQDLSFSILGRRKTSAQAGKAMPQGLQRVCKNQISHTL